MSSGKWFYPLVAALLAVLVLFAWNWYPAPTGNPSEPTNQIYFGPRNSIAVLPFEGGAIVAEQAFWSAGFSSELYHLLIRTPGLRLTSSNSSFYFQDQSVPLRVIAERLHSAHLLTGEFQESDGRLRVEAHLFDAKNDKQLWSEIYDRQLDDVFQIQEDIASAVVDSLRVALLGGAPKTYRADLRAYELFLA